LESVSLNSIRQILPDRAILEACRAAGYSFRRRCITPVVTVLYMLLSAIWPEESFNAAWQVLWDTFRSHSPELECRSPSRGSVTKARQRLPLAVWDHLFAWVSQQAQRLSEPWALWRGHRVVLLDGTCVSMPDTPSLQTTFGTQTGQHGPARYPLARMVALSLAQTMTVMAYAVGAYRTDETVLAESLLDTLQKGDLLIADRHFAAAHFYVRYQRANLEFLTRVHQRLKIARIRRRISYGPDDFVGRLKIGTFYRKKDPSLLDWIEVRFLRARFQIRGRIRTVWLVTSLLDPVRYPAAEIVALYARRWRIETLFREFKIDLSADVLRSQSSDQIRKEIAARMLALNVVRSLILLAAQQESVDPIRISFVHALRAVVCFAPAMAIEPAWKLPSIYETMLGEIADHRVPWRPGRNEPRMITRDRNRYPSLRITRQLWKAKHAA
jgi:Transposase DDE domain/Insertion element 4 transposase N-terminal